MTDEILFLIVVLLVIKVFNRAFVFILEPDDPKFRQVALSDTHAKRLSRAAFAISRLLILGVVVSFLALLLEMSPEAHKVWERIIGFGVFLYIVNLFQEYHGEVAAWLAQGERQLKKSQRFSVLVIEFIALSKAWGVDFDALTDSDSTQEFVLRALS